MTEYIIVFVFGLVLGYRFGSRMNRGRDYKPRRSEPYEQIDLTPPEEIEVKPENRPKPKRKKTIRTKVVGVTFANDDGMNRQRIIKKYVDDGDRLQLIRDYDNKYDANAIGVWTVSPMLQIGHLSRELAKKINVDDVDYVQVTEVTGGYDRDSSFGVNIEIIIK